MICYVLMYTRSVCANDPPCAQRQRCDASHPRRTELVPHKTLSQKPGPANGALARYLKYDAKVHPLGAPWFGVMNEPEDAFVAVVDSSSFRPMLSDAEQAAHRMGGPKAVKRMRKSLG